MPAPLLELEGVSKSFGGLQVILDLDFDVGEREIVSLIGPNGAGKTTVFNLITGLFRADEGEIRLSGENLVGLSPHKITQRGVARTFQSLRLFLNMSVKENVMAAAYGHTRAGVVRSVLRTPRQRREEREISRLAEERLAFFGDRLVGYRWNQPASGMNPAETHEITELIARLRDEGGYTILVIEHDMHVVEGISDRVVALDHGVKIAEGSFDDVATDERVVEAYLGLRATETG
jgi:ABC-type branched-subunit amino acid transport system ATPase component